MRRSRIGCLDPNESGCCAGTPGLIDSAVSGATLSAAPGASYDASGSWHLIIDETVAGQDHHEESDVTFVQDPHGNITITEIPSVTLLRHSVGKKILYKMTVFEPHPSCNTDLSGTAQIDTTTNTFDAKLSGIEEGCDKAQLTVTGVRN
jgi:hypothetical protein